MASLDSLFSVGRSAILAQQAAVQVAGHNIANAETPGYTKEVVDLSASVPERTAQGTFGTGVSIVNVTSARDVLLSQDVRTQNAPAANYKTRADLLGRVESVLGDPSNNTLSTAISNFFNSWSDLSSNPATSSSKTVVQQRAVTLISAFNNYAGQLSAVGTSTRNALSQTVTTINSLAQKIADINKLIVPAESGGQTANDLRDQRDQLLDQLSSQVPITVLDRKDGSNQVLVGGLSIVDGSDAKSLTLGGAALTTVAITGSSDVMRNVGGTLGAQLDFLNTDLPAAKAGLDTLAASIVTDVNAIHETGWSPTAGAAGNWNPASGPTGSGVDFFDPLPANATAQNIRLSGTVAADANAIASGNVQNGPGDNSVALSVAALRDFSPSAPGNSISAAFQTLVSNVAVEKNTADQSATVYQTLADQSSQRRQSATGVSTDEELIKVIRFQQAYIAAGKFLKTVDDMSQSLLQIAG